MDNTPSRQTWPHSQSTASALTEVREGLGKLHGKVDTFFLTVLKRHRQRMRCAAGCASCCHRMPGVFPVEAWVIAEGLKSLGPGGKRLISSLELHVHDVEVTPCPMLDRRGRCRVYALRPIICRSHGAPIKVPGKPTDQWDTCPLNFSSTGMRNHVAAEDVLDVERLNEILTVVDGLFQQSYPMGETLPTRMPLVAGVLHFYKTM